MAIDTPAWKGDPEPFVCLGINLSLPVDKLPPGKYRALQNVRPYGNGQIIGRPGLAPGSTFVIPSPAHTMKLLNDPVPSPNNFPTAFNPFVLYLGDGTELRRGIPPTPGAPPDLNHLVDSGFSGNPLGMVISKPDFSPRPWIYIADSLKMRLASSAFQPPLQWGVSPPNDPPTAALAAVNPNGPDIGATGTPYLYRYRGRKASDVSTGAYGNAGPPMRPFDAAGNPAGIAAHGQNITVTITVAHPDSSVALLDIFRFGGNLPQWTYIGSVSNFAGSSMTDTFSDLDIASNPVLEEDNFQPFPTFDQPRTGNATITPLAGGGSTVVVNSGAALLFYDPLNLDQPYYGFGNQIVIGGNAYTFYKSPTSATVVEVLETAPAPLTADFTMPSPEIWHVPLPFVWGPFGGGFTGSFVFACGDIYGLGNLRWTKGNRPESAPDANLLVVTSPSEPLQNGCMYDGRAWVFSSERLFAIYPNFGGTSDFITIEVPNSKGLYMRWCVCVGPDGIYFRSRDGIYKTAGGSPISVTDKDIYSLFPHEDGARQPFVADGQAPAPDGFGALVPPDDSHEEAQFLSYSDGFLYYDYLGTDGLHHTLVMDVKTEGWVSEDVYSPAVVRHYAEEGGRDYANNAPIHEMLLSGLDGNIYQFSLLGDGTGVNDNGVPIAGRIRTRAVDQGDSRGHKLYGDLFLDYDTSCESLNLYAGFDGMSYFSALASAGAGLTGRRPTIFDINSGRGQHAQNVGLEISWSTQSTQPRFYLWQPSYVLRPVLTILRATDWTDDGYPGAKFVQGFYIEGDSLGVARSVIVESDGGTQQGSAFAFQSSKRAETPYSFTTPFITRLMRIVPQDPNAWRLFKVRWIWEPAPDLALNWITQGTTHDFANFFHHRDARIALISTGPVLFSLTRLDDSSTLSYTIPSTAGIHRKQYLVVSPSKAKIVSYAVTAETPFRLFVKDTSLRVGEWGRSDAYRVVAPFGDVSRERGAII